MCSKGARTRVAAVWNALNRSHLTRAPREHGTLASLYLRSSNYQTLPVMRALPRLVNVGDLDPQRGLLITEPF